MKKIVILPSFERSIRRFTTTEKNRLVLALEKFNDFLVTGRISSGLGFKKIGYDIYEFRIDIRLRVIVKDKDDTFYMVLAGSHEDIKKHLKDFH
jgi:mRNA-degrading endonuclease RelE of RelBE toxin-antitoxin system